MKIFSLNGKSRNNPYQSLAIFIMWLLLWCVVSTQINAFYLPSPLETFRHLIGLLKSIETYKIIAMSLLRVFIGLGLAIFLGVFLGLIAGLFKSVYRFLQPLLVAIKSTPVVSFIVLAILYMDKEFVPSFCGMLLCFPIIYYNVIEGYRMVDAELISMSKLYKIPIKRQLLHLYLPSIAPYIFAGLLTSIGICFKGTIAAEVISVLNRSIGNELYNGKIYLDINAVFAWTIIIIICSLLIEKIIKNIISKYNYYERFKVV